MAMYGFVALCRAMYCCVRYVGLCMAMQGYV